MVTLDQGGRGRATLEFHAIPPVLEWAVEHTWSERPGSSPAHAAARDTVQAWRIVPDPAAHLILTRFADPDGATQIRIVGARSRHLDLDKSRRSLTVGVRLRPGVLPLLTGVPALELLDRSIPLDAVGRRSVAQLHDVLASDSAPSVVRHLHDVLSRALMPARLDWRVRLTARHVERAAGRCSADDLVRQTGISARTLRRALRAGMGVGPKQFTRLRRLHEAIGLALSSDDVPWARVALEAGYVDQPHLTREFNTLLGETPARFLMRRGPA